MRFAPLVALSLVLTPRAAFASPDCPTCTGDLGAVAVGFLFVLGVFALGSRALRWLRARRRRTRRTAARKSRTAVEASPAPRCSQRQREIAPGQSTSRLESSPKAVVIGVITAANTVTTSPTNVQRSERRRAAMPYARMTIGIAPSVR